MSIGPKIGSIETKSTSSCSTLFMSSWVVIVVPRKMQLLSFLKKFLYTLNKCIALVDLDKNI